MSDVDVRVRTMLAETGVEMTGSAALVGLLSSLEERYVDEAALRPGPELAALLAGGEPSVGLRQPARSRPGRRSAAAALAALGIVASTGWAAAANELPSPAQRWVAEFAERYLPFDLPYPDPGVPGGAATPDSRSDGGRPDPTGLPGPEATHGTLVGGDVEPSDPAGSEPGRDALGRDGRSGTDGDSEPAGDGDEDEPRATREDPGDDPAEGSVNDSRDDDSTDDADHSGTEEPRGTGEETGDAEPTPDAEAPGSSTRSREDSDTEVSDSGDSGESSDGSDGATSDMTEGGTDG